MISGIGVDLVEIKRINFKIANRVLSKKELDMFNSLNNDVCKREYLAERFAVKEALFKANNSFFNYDQVSVLNDDKGKPYLENINGHVSITHDGGMVCAFVVILKD